MGPNSQIGRRECWTLADSGADIGQWSENTGEPHARCTHGELGKGVDEFESLDPDELTTPVESAEPFSHD